MKTSNTQSTESGSHVATALIDDSHIPGALLTLRLLAGNGGGELAWQEASPVGCLATDLIGASGGVAVDARGAYLVARFGSVASACLAVRRLQWAVQGLSESDPSEGLVLSALVQAGEDAASDEDSAGFARLEKAAPGKVLISQRAGKTLEDTPAFATRRLDPNTTELIWRSSDEQVSRAADDRTLARFTRELHGESAVAAEPGSSQPTPTTLMKAPAVEKYNISVPEPAARRANLGWVVGLVAVVAVAVGGYLFYTRSSESAKPPVQAVNNPSQANPPNATNPGANAPNTGGSIQAQPVTPKTSAPDNGPASPPDHKLTRREKEKLLKQQQQQQQQVASEQAPPKEKPQPPAQEQTPKVEPGGNCQIGLDEIPAMLNRAENARANADYPRAKRMFLSVIACDHGNRRAQDGLQLVLQALRAQGQDQ